ncbi:MAG: TetR family transcriptional regulator, partial [Streptomyces sp.]|nr:TetR family transcriptional regulator [Streptomyces sp.]
LAPRVLAAAVSAAARVAVESWIHPAEDAEGQGGASLLVVPNGSLPDLLREALASISPALKAADRASF